MRIQVQFLASLSGWANQWVQHMEVPQLWLWCRPAAAALIRPLAWELSFAPKKKKKKWYSRVFGLGRRDLLYRRMPANECWRHHKFRNHLFAKTNVFVQMRIKTDAKTGGPCCLRKGQSPGLKISNHMFPDLIGKRERSGRYPLLKQPA